MSNATCSSWLTVSSIGMTDAVSKSPTPSWSPSPPVVGFERAQSEAHLLLGCAAPRQRAGPRRQKSLLTHQLSISSPVTLLDDTVGGGDDRSSAASCDMDMDMGLVALRSQLRPLSFSLARTTSGPLPIPDTL
jgi:hypothetical protein